MNQYQFSLNQMDENLHEIGFSRVNIDEFNRLDLPFAYKDIKQQRKEDYAEGIYWCDFSNDKAKNLKINTVSHPNGTEYCIFRYNNGKLDRFPIFSSQSVNKCPVYCDKHSRLCVLIFNYNIDYNHREFFSFNDNFSFEINMETKNIPSSVGESTEQIVNLRKLGETYKNIAFYTGFVFFVGVFVGATSTNHSNRIIEFVFENAEYYGY